METRQIGSPHTSEPRDVPGDPLSLSHRIHENAPDIRVTPPSDSHRVQDRNRGPSQRSESRHSSLRSDGASSISLSANSPQSFSGTRRRDSEAGFGAIQGYGLPFVEGRSDYRTDVRAIEDTPGTSRETETTHVAQPEPAQSSSSSQGAGLSAADLKKHLRRAIDRSSPYPEHKFLPQSDLDTLVNKQNIFTALISSGSRKLLDPNRHRLPSNSLGEILGSKIPLTRRKRLRDHQDDIQELAGRIVSPVSQSQPRGSGQPERCHRGSYRKIFAILVLIDQIGHIRRFVDDDEVCDDDLPLTTTRKGRGDKSPKLAIRSADEQYGQEPLECARRLGPSAVEAFMKRQQWMSVASLTGDPSIVPYFEFQEHEILPWISKDEIYVGHHHVSRVKIHRDHYHFPHYDSGRDKGKDHNHWYCLKSFEHKNDYESEMIIAKQFRFERHKHKHIGQVVACFRHGNTHAMVLPWAESDLLKYWKKKEPGPGSALWMVRQCSGIVSALQKIHFYNSGLDSEIGSARRPRSAHSFSEPVIATSLQPTSGRMCRAQSCPPRPPQPSQEALVPSVIPSSAFSDTTHDNTVGGADKPQELWYGRHGDIKPANILWFPGAANGEAEGGGGVNEGGILRIIDFGISEFSRTKNYAEIRNTPTYRSPECDTEGPVSSLCDIWALGCMFVEFVTWYFYGWAGVAQFERERLSPDRKMVTVKGVANTPVFFEPDESGRPRLKPDVVQHIEELRGHEDCPASIRDLLDIVTAHMLVVSIEQADGFNIPRRANSKVLERLFCDLLRNCNSDDYTNKPYPREITERRASGGFKERVKRSGLKKAKGAGGITRSNWISGLTQRKGSDTGRTGFRFSSLIGG